MPHNSVLQSHDREENRLQMAHCSSSHVPSQSFVRPDITRSGHIQELLPPRKRLLFGLKHAAAIPPDTSTMVPPPPESLRVEVHVNASHTPPAPPHSLLLSSPTQKCFTCGDGGVLLHRVPYLAGSSGYHCSSCVLEMNKKLYCVLCYEIVDEGSLSPPSSDLVTCCKCERRMHHNCALKSWPPSVEAVGLTFCKECYIKNNGQIIDAQTVVQEPAGMERLKECFISAGKVKLPLLDRRELIAARLVAVTAKKAALKARQKAKLLAKSAACAAVHARAALDDLYKRSQKEAECVSANENLKEDVIITASRTSKSLKTRALSSIVASEMSSKRDGTTANHMVTPDYPESKNQVSSDSESADTASPWNGVEPGRRVTQKARLGVKRRKSMSLLGLQKSSSTLASLKRSSLASRKIQKKTGFLSKGNLGAIMSQVIASNKLSISSMKEPFWKEKAGESHRATMTVSSENGIMKNMQSIAAMGLDNVCSPDDVCSS